MRRWNVQPGLISLAIAAMCWVAPFALAQNPPAWMGGSAGTVPPKELNEVAVIEHNGTMLPLELPLVDEEGNAVQLKQYFGSGKKPVVLQLGYFGCPMLCSLMSKGMVTSLNEIGLIPGKDFEYVFVSIDPTEKPELAKQKKAAFVEAFKQSGAQGGFHLLTGRQEAISRLAQIAGFGYKWVQSAGQYAHPAVILIVMPDGKISRYLYGVQFEKQTLRLSLVEASDGKVGTTVDQFILKCFQYDGTQGKYAMTALTIMRGGGILSVLVVASGLTFLFRREAKMEARRRAQESSGDVSGTQPM